MLQGTTSRGGGTAAQAFEASANNQATYDIASGTSTTSSTLSVSLKSPRRQSAAVWSASSAAHLGLTRPRIVVARRFRRVHRSPCALLSRVGPASRVWCVPTRTRGSPRPQTSRSGHLINALRQWPLSCHLLLRARPTRLTTARIVRVVAVPYGFSSSFRQLRPVKEQIQLWALHRAAWLAPHQQHVPHRPAAGFAGRRAHSSPVPRTTPAWPRSALCLTPPLTHRRSLRQRCTRPPKQAVSVHQPTHTQTTRRPPRSARSCAWLWPPSA
jgi:hypothetical protein